jgi:hypothetical protein
LWRLPNPHSSLFKAHFRHTQSGLGAIVAVNSEFAVRSAISPIGIGGAVNQVVNFNIDNDSKVIEYLAKLLAVENPSAAEGTRAVGELVNNSENGGPRKGKAGLSARAWRGQRYSS